MCFTNTFNLFIEILNSFTQNRISRSYQLDQSISVLRADGW